MKLKKKNIKYLIVFLFFCFAFDNGLLESSFCLSHKKKLFDIVRPTADISEIENLISEDFARKIVIVNAKGRWEKYAVGRPIYCSDDNGKLVSYMFPVKINDDEFPNDYIIFSRNLYRDIKKHSFDWGTGEFWTFVVSARTSDYPVPCEFNTLPPLYVTLFESEEVAKYALKKEKVTFERFYFLGHRGEYFEFSSSEKSILIHAYRIAPFETDRVLIRKGETELDRLQKYQLLSSIERINYETYRQQVKEEWETLKYKIKRMEKQSRKKYPNPPPKKKKNLAVPIW